MVPDRDQGSYNVGGHGINVNVIE